MSDVETTGGEAPAEDRAVKTKKVRRNDLIREIYLLGWTGPISYANEKLQEMIDDIKAGREPNIPSRGRRRKPEDAAPEAGSEQRDAAGEPGAPSDVVTAEELAQGQPGPQDSET